MRTVYIETSILRHLAAPPGRDVVLAARRQITWEWWTTQRKHFLLNTSEFVLEAYRREMQEKTETRNDFAGDIALLECTDEARKLADGLSESLPYGPDAREHVMHAAIAAVHGMDFLVTWDFRYLANANTASALSERIRERGFCAPLIGTPEQLAVEPMYEDEVMREVRRAKDELAATHQYDIHAFEKVMRGEK